MFMWKIYHDFCRTMILYSHHVIFEKKTNIILFLFFLTLSSKHWSLSLINVCQICSAIVASCIWKTFCWHSVEISEMTNIHYKCAASCFSAWKLKMRNQILSALLFKMRSESSCSLKSMLSFNTIINRLIRSHCY